MQISSFKTGYLLSLLDISTMEITMAGFVVPAIVEEISRYGIKSRGM